MSHILRASRRQAAVVVGSLALPLVALFLVVHFGAASAQGAAGPGAAPAACGGTRIGTLCFSRVSAKTFQFAELDDYCASLGMKVPGIAEYSYAMPLAPAGHFPVGESIWMSESWQYNRNLGELGSAVVWYAPGSWNRGPMSASAQLKVSCVDRLLAGKESARSYYVGFAKDRVLQLAKTTAQKDAMWCWAAVAQMIQTVRGQAMAQEDIVRIALGDVAGKGVSASELARRLQKVGIEAVEDKNVPIAGPAFQVSRDGKNFQPLKPFNPLGDSAGPESIDSRQLALDLFDGTPYILAYGTGTNRAHAVLLVGLDVVVTPSDFKQISHFELWRYTHKVVIKSYHVINPWPGKGYQVVSPDELQELVKWKVKVPPPVQNGPF